MPGQLQSLQLAVANLSKLVAESQSSIAPLLNAVPALEARLGELEASSVSPQSIEQVRQEMRRFYTATRQKELMLEAAIAEISNLRHQVLLFERTLSESH